MPYRAAMQYYSMLWAGEAVFIDDIKPTCTCLFGFGSTNVGDFLIAGNTLT